MKINRRIYHAVKSGRLEVAFHLFNAWRDRAVRFFGSSSVPTMNHTWLWTKYSGRFSPLGAFKMTRLRQERRLRGKSYV